MGPMLAGNDQGRNEINQARSVGCIQADCFNVGDEALEVVDFLVGFLGVDDMSLGFLLRMREEVRRAVVIIDNVELVGGCRCSMKFRIFNFFLPERVSAQGDLE